jgi:signal transduction histidine kinase/PAS domain-containing protein
MPEDAAHPLSLTETTSGGSLVPPLQNGAWNLEIAQSAAKCLELLDSGRLHSEPADLLLLSADLPGSALGARQREESSISPATAFGRKDAVAPELLARIKQSYPDLPVIMIMPAGAEAELAGTRAMHHDAHAYVTKSPGWETRLPLMIDQWLQGEKTHQDFEHAASELSELRQHYQTILAYTREAVLALNPSGFIVHFSPTAERILGYSAAEVIGEHISIFYDSTETVQGILDALSGPVAQATPGGIEDSSVQADDESFVAQATSPVDWRDLRFLPGVLHISAPDPENHVIHYEAFLRHRQGHFLIFEVTTAAVYTEGALTGYLSFCHELTEQRDAQREILRTRALLQAIMETAPVNIFIIGPTGNISAASGNVERSLGYSPDALIGTPVADLVRNPRFLTGPGPLRKLESLLERTRLTGEPQQFILELIDASGRAENRQIFTARMPASSIPRETGAADLRSASVIMITTDLSEQSHQLEALREELEQLRLDERKARALFETAATLANTDDLYGVFAQIAESAATHLGFDQVMIYRADHEQGLLVGVVRCGTPDAAEGGNGARETGAQAPSPEESSIPVDPGLRANEPQPLSNVIIKLAPGEGPLADFALSGEACRVEPSQVLVRMQTPGDSAEAGLLGVISSMRATITPQQVHLLCSLAQLGSVANERARMERLRTQLISSVSHELRTPLAAIRAYNELVLDGDAGPINDEQRLFLSRVEATSIQLNRILDDLLDLSRMRAGELSVHKSITDVAACIQHIINTAQPEAAKRNITVESRIPAELPAIVTDPDRLSQVLMNLVDNALKYGHEGGFVLVEAKVDSGLEAGPDGDNGGAQGSSVVIAVADDGPGIPAEELDKIFEEFHRGGHGAERNTKGAGLGLAIVSRLVRLLGGSVSVDSTVGEGSTFHLRFPLAQLIAEEQ